MHGNRFFFMQIPLPFVSYSRNIMLVLMFGITEHSEVLWTTYKDLQVEQPQKHNNQITGNLKKAAGITMGNSDLQTEDPA